MTVSFGSGQTSGLPLVVTALTQLTAQTLHTAVAGTGPAQRVRITAQNLDTKLPHAINIGLFATGAALSAPTLVWQVELPINEGALSVTDPNFTATIPELDLNGATYIAVWTDTASMVAVSAMVDDQDGVAGVTAGSAQTGGLPLIPTTQIAAVGVLPVTNSGLLVHTAPAGTATPNEVSLFAVNTDTVGRHATIGIFAVGTTVPIIAWQVAVPPLVGLYNLTDVLGLTKLVLNGTSFIQVWTTVASTLAFFVSSNTQAEGGGGGGGTSAQQLGSGLMAGVISAARYGLDVNGGTGTATIANAQQMIPGNGTIARLSAKADVTITGAASLTCSLFKNGVATTQSVILTAASTTLPQTTTGAPVTVAPGDLITFGIVETAGVAPVANIQVCAELTLNS